MLCMAANEPELRCGLHRIPTTPTTASGANVCCIIPALFIMTSRPAPSLPLRTPPLVCIGLGKERCFTGTRRDVEASCHAGHGLPVFPSPSQLLRACACVCGCARAILMSSPIAELPGCVRWRARLLCHAANQTGEVSHGQHRTWTACQKEAGDPRVTPHLSDPHPALSELLVVSESWRILSPRRLARCGLLSMRHDCAFLDFMMRRQMEFWQELCQGYPSLSRLDSIGVDYENCVKRAERGFVTVLQLDSKSVSVMRKYAQFLIEVRGGLSPSSTAGLRLAT
jgi:hypothetical protein